MKRILLLFSIQSHRHKLSDPERLTNLLNQAGNAKFEYAYFSDITFFVNPGTAIFVNELTSLRLEEYDAIYLRHWGMPDSQGNALAIARYCKLKQIPFIDREVLRTGSLNKLTQYINLLDAEVPFPRTFMAEGRHIQGGIIRHEFTYPFIVKGAKASRGEDNFLVHNEAKLLAVLEGNAETSLVLQDYIPNQGDYRILVFGNSVKLVIRRRAIQGTHLNNTSKGGIAELVEPSELPDSVIRDSIKAAAFFGRDVAGVDMVIDHSGRHYCFEVNRAPQIEHSSFEREKADITARYLAELADGHKV